MTIVVIGDFMKDQDEFYTSVRKSPEGEWPVVVKDRMEIRSGGAGAVVEMIRGLGWPESHITMFGHYRARCLRRRVYVDGKQVFREDQDQIYPLWSGYADRIISELPADYPARASLILVADYGKGMITDYLWRRLVDTGIPIIVDPARNKPLESYHGAQGICPNRVEAGVSSLSEATVRFHELLRLYPFVCLKLDRDGMIAGRRGGPSRHILAECLKPVDVCGAGDMVLAAIGVLWSFGADWVDACSGANHLAGRKCGQVGATPVDNPISLGEPVNS